MAKGFGATKAPPFQKGGAKGKGPLKKGNPFAKGTESPAEEKAEAMQGFKKGGSVKRKK